MHSGSDKNIITQKYPFGDGLALVEMGVFSKRRTGDINDIGDDWWEPAHSSWGVVFMRRCGDLAYEAVRNAQPAGRKMLIPAPHEAHDKRQVSG